MRGCFAVSRGPMTSEAASVLVFDLDGTLIPDNSHHAWMVELFRGEAVTPCRFRSLVLRGACGAIAAGRLARLYSHARMKWLMQGLWQGVARDPRAERVVMTFVDALMARVRPEFNVLLSNAARQGIPRALATAAVEQYATPLAERLGLELAAASPAFAPWPQWRENLGEEKRRHVRAWLDERGLGDRLLILFTDHEDDAPLCREAALVVWCGIAEKAWDRMNQSTGSNGLPLSHIHSDPASLAAAVSS